MSQERQKSLARNDKDKENRIGNILDRLIEIVRRLLLAVIWFFGGGFSLVIVTLSLNEGNPPFYLAILIAFGFFVLSYTCHTLLNWILAKK